jgi:hypothetical protein
MTVSHAAAFRKSWPRAANPEIAICGTEAQKYLTSLPETAISPSRKLCRS